MIFPAGNAPISTPHAWLPQSDVDLLGLLVRRILGTTLEVCMVAARKNVGTHPIYTYMYMHICICMCTCMYTYTYTYIYM